MITIFSPSFVDETNTNAQNLTVKEIVSRLSPEQFRVIVLSQGSPDPRVAGRRNTRLLKWTRHGNTARWLTSVLMSGINIYFFPREGPLDTLFLTLRRSLRLPIALVTYIVMALDHLQLGTTMTRAIQQADQVIANSSYVAKTLQDRFGIVAGVIYDGVRRDWFYPRREAQRNRSERRVLYAGSFQARKRVEVVIREAAKRPRVNFRLAGKGVEEEKCRALVTMLGCRNVSFLGHLSQADLGQEMREADVFLFPSILEGHPQVLVQAASCGLPAVAMNVYRPEYVVHGETGYLVESDDELAQKLDLLLADQDVRGRMAVAAARRAIEFDWDRVTAAWERVFLDVVGRRVKSR